MDPDVVGEVEGGGVDPQGPAQPPPGPVQQLPEARDQLQPRLEVPTDGLGVGGGVGGRAPSCTLGSRCRRTASMWTRPSGSSSLVPSRMASTPMSWDQPKSSD